MHTPLFLHNLFRPRVPSFLLVGPPLGIGGAGGKLSRSPGIAVSCRLLSSRGRQRRRLGRRRFGRRRLWCCRLGRSCRRVVVAATAGVVMPIAAAGRVVATTTAAGMVMPIAAAGMVMATAATFFATSQAVAGRLVPLGCRTSRGLAVASALGGCASLLRRRRRGGHFFRQCTKRLGITRILRLPHLAVHSRGAAGALGTLGCRAGACAAGHRHVLALATATAAAALRPSRRRPRPWRTKGNLRQSALLGA